MGKSEPIVFIVDDDQAVRQSLTALAESIGLMAQTFGKAEDFLNAYDPAQPGCLLLDIRMPGMSGLELQSKLNAEGIHIPVIIITEHGDIPMAVSALKAGAVNFIEKSCKDQLLIDNINKAIEIDAKLRCRQAARAEVVAKVGLLTSREREIADLLLQGRSNKNIGYDLGISQKTVDFHRVNILRKMGVDSLVSLLRLMHRAGLEKIN